MLILYDGSNIKGSELGKLSVDLSTYVFTNSMNKFLGSGGGLHSNSVAFHSLMLEIGEPFGSV